ncbi:hypothetical protein OUZ56_000713 [Daphnia magna]|uniref:Uncharacterized protein n=1 Tax=Daphnia magna TaxID=35525 RepID=A0ABR0A0J0_9CRUS|nr:hypothetical protein OUZ56_000713 [Daphnia magna]
MRFSLDGSGNASNPRQFVASAASNYRQPAPRRRCALRLIQSHVNMNKTNETTPCSEQIVSQSFGITVVWDATVAPTLRS